MLQIYYILELLLDGFGQVFFFNIYTFNQILLIQIGQHH